MRDKHLHRVTCEIVATFACEHPHLAQACSSVHYIRDASGNVLSIYEENNKEETDQNKIITQVEIPIYGAGKLGTYYPAQDGSMNYEITDHLGNVRALLRDNANVYTASMEDNGKAEIDNPAVYEGAFFENLNKVRMADIHANHTAPSQEVAAPDKSAYLNWISGIAGNDASDKAVGSAMMLEVNVGDKVDIKTWAKYEIKQSYNRDITMLALSQLLGASALSTPGIIDGVLPSQMNSAFNSGLSLGNFADDGADQTKPFAYLNYIVFDKNLVYVSGDKVRVPENAGYETVALNLATSVPQPLAIDAPVNITADGYIYVWVSNESENTKVWFDDLTITHTGALVAQATDYGVWGDVLREQKAREADYRFGYQGQYAEKDDETGWSHFELREFDPIAGRWFANDPKRIGFSPYVGMTNNPLANLDPDGGGPIKVTTDRGKYLFTLDDGKVETTTMTLRQLYALRVQWMEPLADNYMPIMDLNPEIKDFPELKHFTWDKILEFSMTRRHPLAFLQGFWGDWKYVSEGADEFLAVTVDGQPYWADAVGQIPFAINALRSSTSRSISDVIASGRKYGSGSLIGDPENGNIYDIYFVLRGAEFAAKKFHLVIQGRWGYEKQTDYSASNLGAPITAESAQQYLH